MIAIPKRLAPLRDEIRAAVVVAGWAPESSFFLRAMSWPRSGNGSSDGKFFKFTDGGLTAAAKWADDQSRGPRGGHRDVELRVRRFREDGKPDDSNYVVVGDAPQVQTELAERLLADPPVGTRGVEPRHASVVLGVALTNPKHGLDAIERHGLASCHMPDKQHRRVLEAVLAVHGRGAPVDAVTVGEVVPDLASFLVDLAEEFGSHRFPDADHHAAELVTLSRRQETRVALAAADRAVSAEGPVDQAAVEAARVALDQAVAEPGASLTAARELAADLPGKAESDPGAPFERQALAALRLLRRQDHAAFQRTLAALKATKKINMGDLRQALEEATAQPSPREDSPVSTEVGTGCPYGEPDGKLTWFKDDTTVVPLMNGTARAVAWVEEDQGDGEARAMREVRVQVAKRAPMILKVPANEFPSLSWTTQVPGLVLEPGQGVRERVRHGIEILSGYPPTRRVFTHTGWAKLANGHMVYLNAAGAIGAAGPVPGIEVDLPSFLSSFVLPPPPRGAELVRAVQASLGTLKVAPYRITLPLLGLTYRAPLGRCDFSGAVVGRTGTGKSEASALAQQHYGACHVADKLPASWTSTENALELQAFACKDGLLVCDDFKPSGDPADDRALHRKADRLLRAQANGAGRARLRRDSTFMTPKAPRGLILTTGEELPRGESLRARMLVVEIKPGEVDFDRDGRKGRLTAAQADGRNGLLAAAMAGYVCWLAPRIEALQAGWSGRVAALRAELAAEGTHRRTSEIAAELYMAIETFAQFAQEAKALEEDAANQLLAEARGVLAQLGAEQADLQVEVDPVDRFQHGLRAAIAAGRAHVANREGGPPPTANGWGWRRSSPGSESWQPMGVRVGWVEVGDVFLLPGLAHQASEQAGSFLGISVETLNRRLRDRGLLHSRRDGRLTTKRRFEGGHEQNVIHVKAAWLGVGPVEDLAPDPEVAPAETEVTEGLEGDWGQWGRRGHAPNGTPGAAEEGVA